LTVAVTALTVPVTGPPGTLTVTVAITAVPRRAALRPTPTVLEAALARSAIPVSITPLPLRRTLPALKPPVARGTPTVTTAVPPLSRGTVTTPPITVAESPLPVTSLAGGPSPFATVSRRAVAIATIPGRATALTTIPRRAVAIATVTAGPPALATVTLATVILGPASVSAAITVAGRAPTRVARVGPLPALVPGRRSLRTVTLGGAPLAIRPPVTGGPVLPERTAVAIGGVAAE
jgi:hypothetical protein